MSSPLTPRILWGEQALTVAALTQPAPRRGNVHVRPDGILTGAAVRDRDSPLDFTGGILARGDAPRGSRWWAAERVVELSFDRGRLVAADDRSESLRALTLEAERRAAIPLAIERAARRLLRNDYGEGRPARVPPSRALSERLRVPRELHVLGLECLARIDAMWLARPDAERLVASFRRAVGLVDALRAAGYDVRRSGRGDIVEIARPGWSAEVVPEHEAPLFEALAPAVESGSLVWDSADVGQGVITVVWRFERGRLDRAPAGSARFADEGA